MRIVVIGAGRLGAALGRRLAEAGHDVRRGRSSAGWAQITVLAVPQAAVPEAVRRADLPPGAIVWSCGNALRQHSTSRSGGRDSTSRSADSAADQVARCAPQTRVVAAIPPPVQALVAGELLYDNDLRPSVFVCADDDQAKAVVETLVFDLGAHPVDAGPLGDARLVEPAMLLLARIASAGLPRDVALRLLERT